MAKKMVCALLLGALVVSLTGCRPSEPSRSEWRTSAEQAVSDMVSEVATSRLAVRRSLADEVVGRYAVVLLTYAEEAAGSAQDSVSSLQPPPGARPRYDALTTTLSDAADAISHARIAVTAGDDAASRRAVVELTRTLESLRPLQDQLRGSP